MFPLRRISCGKKVPYLKNFSGLCGFGRVLSSAVALHFCHWSRSPVCKGCVKLQCETSRSAVCKSCCSSQGSVACMSFNSASWQPKLQCSPTKSSTSGPAKASKLQCAPAIPVPLQSSPHLDLPARRAEQLHRKAPKLQCSHFRPCESFKTAVCTCDSGASAVFSTSGSACKKSRATAQKSP